MIYPFFHEISQKLENAPLNFQIPNVTYSKICSCPNSSPKHKESSFIIINDRKAENHTHTEEAKPAVPAQCIKSVCFHYSCKLVCVPVLCLLLHVIPCCFVQFSFCICGVFLIILSLNLSFCYLSAFHHKILLAFFYLSFLASSFWVLNQ